MKIKEIHSIGLISLFSVWYQEISGSLLFNTGCPVVALYFITFMRDKEKKTVQILFTLIHYLDIKDGF